MNLGLSLYKPGESSLGTAMRLWFANRASWYFTTSRTRSSITTLTELKELNTPNFVRLHLFDESTELYLFTNARKQLSIDKRRQCVTCANKAYHSVLFDYHWLTHCPVHNEVLVDRCPECGSNWPTESSVVTRDCKVCGIRRPIESLIEQSAFDPQPYEEHLPQFLKILTTKVPNIYSKRQYPFSIVAARSCAQTRRNTKISVVAYYNQISDSENTMFIDYGLIIPSWYLRKIPRTPSNPDNCVSTLCSQSDLLLMADCRDRIYRLALRSLENQANHKLGSCDKEPNHGHFECVFCETWRQLISGFLRIIEKKSDQIVISYNLPFGSKVLVPDPGIVKELVDYDDGEKEIAIDIKSSSLIYQIELWLCFRKMFIQIDTILNRGFDINVNSSSSVNSNREFLSQHKHHFAYFNFVKNNGQYFLQFPKEYIGRKLTSYDQLLLLFS